MKQSRKKMSSKASGLFAESKKRAEQKLKKRKGNYIHAVRDELKKVSWTSKEELKMCTKIVIIATFSFGIGIFAVDLIVRHCLVGINNLVSLVGG